MKRRIRSLLIWLVNRLKPRTDPEATITDLRAQNRLLMKMLPQLLPDQRERDQFGNFVDLAAEWIEARLMSGPGPWRQTTGPIQAQAALLRIQERALGKREAITVEESVPLLGQGAFGDIELALQNVEWRREVNMSWLEFSRWGIQQIILISRLYYVKNPIIRRLIDVAAAYVFARGVEVTSSDQTANDVLKEFFSRNRKTLGKIALAKHERRKYYDGNLFFAFFADTQDKGLVECRLIDATEIQDIEHDPEDEQKPWYYKRAWTQKIFNTATGEKETKTTTRYYPALDYEPDEKPTAINGIDVMWDCRIHHRKCGEVAQWTFGCPMIYPGLDWARAARRFLEACLTVRQALAQIAMTLTTKGGQQALEGAKQQLQTSVAVDSTLWDTNPPAVQGSTFASGPGTKLEAFNTKGAGGDPEEVRQYKLMCCMVVGVPETFLADVSTGNLATATTLDRPTELCFLEKQESWREDLLIIAEYVLRVSKGAASGRLRESLGEKVVCIREATRKQKPNGQWVYEATPADSQDIEISINFPNIVEGDIPLLVKATVDAMTLGNLQGQVVGIDERAGVRLLYDQLGIEDGDELIEAAYPEKEYDPDRTAEPPPPEPQPFAPPAQAIAQTKKTIERLVQEAMRKFKGRAA